MAKRTKRSKRLVALVTTSTVLLSPFLTSAFTSGSANAASGVKIALLLPQNGVPRFDRWDMPFFVAEMKKVCPTCKVLYYNALNEDAARQQQQAEAALANGAKVLVICPVDGKAAKVIANEAAAKGVPVVSYE